MTMRITLWSTSFVIGQKKKTTEGDEEKKLEIFTDGK